MIEDVFQGRPGGREIVADTERMLRRVTEVYSEIERGDKRKKHELAELYRKFVERVKEYANHSKRDAQTEEVARCVENAEGVIVDNHFENPVILRGALRELKSKVDKIR